MTFDDRRLIQDTERPHWVQDLTDESKDALKIKDRPKESKNGN